MTDRFIKQLPKIELHAHINGSISRETMQKLLLKKGDNCAENEWKLMFEKGETSTLDNIFRMFRLIHLISCNTEAVYTITYDVIHEFAADNVKYLELRTTPRENTSSGMTKHSHIQTVLKAIDDCSKEPELDIIVKLLLSIDRRNSVAVAMETVELADQYSKSGVVVGVDLSGDPNVGDASVFIPVLQEAKRRGLRLALHLAEVPAVTETWELLKVPPDRIGHGTCLHREAGGTDDIAEYVAKHKIPLELCLTSNILAETVSSFENHQFCFWFERDHPLIICTDDKGVFSTSTSEEYRIAKDTFSLTDSALWDLSFNSIEYIFADDSVKAMLKEKWLNSKSSLCTVLL